MGVLKEENSSKLEEEHFLKLRIVLKYSYLMTHFALQNPCNWAKKCYFTRAPNLLGGSC